MHAHAIEGYKPLTLEEHKAITELPAEGLLVLLLNSNNPEEVCRAAQELSIHRINHTPILEAAAAQLEDKPEEELTVQERLLIGLISLNTNKILKAYDDLLEIQYYSPAQYLIAEILIRSGETKPKRAIEFLEKAIAQGCTQSLLRLYTYTFDKKIHDKRFEARQLLFNQAEKNHNEIIQHYLAVSYTEGDKGFKKNLKLAFKWSNYPPLYSLRESICVQIILTYILTEALQNLHLESKDEESETTVKAIEFLREITAQYYLTRMQGVNIVDDTYETNIEYFNDLNEKMPNNPLILLNWAMITDDEEVIAEVQRNFPAFPKLDFAGVSAEFADAQRVILSIPLDQMVSAIGREIAKQIKEKIQVELNGKFPHAITNIVWQFFVAPPPKAPIAVDSDNEEEHKLELP